MYIEKHHFNGPDNISINQLTVSELMNILSALRVADNVIPIASNIRLEEEITVFLESEARL